MGKGSRRRQEDSKKIRDNWDKIKWPEKKRLNKPLTK